MKRTVLATLTALTALSGAAYANPGNGNGNGWGGGNIPPGQAKKLFNQQHGDRTVVIDDRRHVYRSGDRLPDGYVVIRDYDRYGLRAPGDGYRYVRYDNEVYRIAHDTATVAAAIGIVSDLLN